MNMSFGPARLCLGSARPYANVLVRPVLGPRATPQTARGVSSIRTQCLPLEPCTTGYLFYRERLSYNLPTFRAITMLTTAYHFITQFQSKPLGSPGPRPRPAGHQ